MQIYDVTQSGETAFVTAPTLKEALVNNKVLIIVVDDLKTIYLWKGKDSPVRKKFIGARIAQAVRGECGLTFKVEPTDQDEEPQALRDLFEVQPSASSRATKSMDLAAPGEAAEEQESRTVVVTLSPEMKERLMGEPLPEGFDREGIIIGSDYYGIIKSTSTVLGKIVESSDIQKTAELPDGQLFDQSYGIRLLVENGNITAVEILKRQ